MQNELQQMQMLEHTPPIMWTREECSSLQSTTSPERFAKPKGTVVLQESCSQR